VEDMVDLERLTRSTPDVVNVRKAFRRSLDGERIAEAKNCPSSKPILPERYTVRCLSRARGKSHPRPLFGFSVVIESSPPSFELLVGHAGAVVPDKQGRIAFFGPRNVDVSRTVIPEIRNELDQGNYWVSEDLSPHVRLQESVAE